jgi:DNA-directed RNA polymerase subunit RPC12/RpoP
MNATGVTRRSIKVTLNKNIIRRISLDLSSETLTYSSLYQTIQKLFSLRGPFKVTWIDDEGDVISISSDAEMNEAIHIMETFSISGSLKFGVTTNADDPPPEQQSFSHPINPFSQYRCHYCKDTISEGVWYQIISENSQISCELCESRLQLSQQSLSIKMYNSSHHSLVENYLKGVSLAKPAASLESNREKLWRFIPKQTNESDSTDWRKPQSPVPSSSTSSWGEISSSNRSPARSKPMCRFIRDVSYLDGEKVPPSTEFRKTWRVKNDGNRPWPDGCQLAPAGGDHFQIGENTQLPPLGASDEVDLTVTLLSPPIPGRYVSYYRPQTLEGKWFGQRLWADIRVASEPPAPADQTADEQAATPWQHELSILSTMGFHNREDCIARLQKFSFTPRGLLIGQTQPLTSAEILQLTIFDLLRK